MKLKRRNTAELITLETKHPVAVGPESCLYSIHGAPDKVAKVYRTDGNDFVRRILAMIAHPPIDPTAAQRHVSIAWPIDLLYTEDLRDCAGYLMPRVGQARPLAEMINPTTRRHVAPLFNYRYLYRTARNLAGSLDALHASDYVVGDLNDTGVLVADSALVTMIDTETFQIRDRASSTIYRCLTSRPEYTAPELQDVALDSIDRQPDQDCFALAILIFQLLMEGTHPFGGDFTGTGSPISFGARIKAGYYVYGTTAGPYAPRSSSPPIAILPPSIRELFQRCFEDGHASPRVRPGAREWVDALQDAEAHMAACSVNSEHIYPANLDACPWCKRAGAPGSHDPFPSRDAVEFDRAGAHTVAQAPLPSAGAKPSRPAAPTQRPPATAPRPAVSASAAASPQPGATVRRPPSPPTPMPVRHEPERKSPVIAWGIAFAIVALVGFGIGYLKLHHPASIAGASPVAASSAQPAYQGYLATAKTDLAQTTAEDADASAAAQSFAQAAHLCKQALHDISANPTSAAADQSSAQSLLAQVEARQLALDARVELDDVTASIKANEGRRLTAAEVSTLKARLLTDCTKAQDDCTQALARDPQGVSGWIERVRAYRLSADKPGALSALNKALAAFPSDPHLLDQQAQLNGAT